jgi:hypothetical protein
MRQQVQRTCGGADLAGGDSQVSGSSRQTAVAEQQLNGADIDARFQKMNRKCVSKRIRGNWLAVAGESAGLLASQFRRVFADVVYASGQRHLLFAMKRCCHRCMTTTRAVGQYVRRSRAEWSGIVEEYQQSGKSRTVFSLERGISVKSLDYQVLKSRRAVRTGPRLLPVELVSSPTSDAMLRVELANGRRIAVGAGFDAELLRRVVAVLER